MNPDLSAPRGAFETGIQPARGWQRGHGREQWPYRERSSLCSARFFGQLPAGAGGARLVCAAAVDDDDGAHRGKLEYDLSSIRRFSFFLDASIVLETIHTMIFGRGR